MAVQGLVRRAIHLSSGAPEASAARALGGDPADSSRTRPPRGPITAPSALLLVAALFGSAAAQTRDTAFYPVSGHPPAPVAAPPLLFDKVFETVLPGRPLDDPLAGPDATGRMTVQTRSGVFRIDASDGSIQPEPPAPPGSTAPPGAATDVPAPVPSRPPPVPVGARTVSERLPRGADGSRETPTWLARLGAGAPASLLTWGPDDLVAVLRTDGTIEGRERRRGHMLWRHVASHRLSVPALSMGAYLLLAPDASSSLEAIRWSDGSAAGVFKLASEEASFASAPRRSGDLVLVLAVQTPLEESRLLGLRARAAEAPPEPASVNRDGPPPPAKSPQVAAPSDPSLGVKTPPQD